jgi:hypothetical protein
MKRLEKYKFNFILNNYFQHTSQSKNQRNNLLNKLNKYFHRIVNNSHIIQYKFLKHIHKRGLI